MSPAPASSVILRSRRARFALAALSISGIAAMAWAGFAASSIRVVYNPSSSVPVGWYGVQAVPVLTHHSLPVGSIVLTRVPGPAASLAAQRGYLPAHVPLLKRVGAVAPQHVCIEAGQVRIDGEPVAVVLRTDSQGRALTAWAGCRQLADGEIFLLSDTHPASFDSRYFGPVRVDSVLGLARRIEGWRWP